MSQSYSWLLIKLTLNQFGCKRKGFGSAALDSAPKNGGLLEPVNDAGLVQIVGGHFQFYPVACGEADEALAHFARDVREDFVVIVERDAEHGPGEH